MIQVDASTSGNGGALVARIAELYAAQDRERNARLLAMLRQSRCRHCGTKLQEAAAASERREWLATPLDHERYCSDCGFSHDMASRRRRLLRLLPCTAREVMDAFPCQYGRGLPESTERHAGERRMFRDLRAVGALSLRGFWMLPEKRAGAR